MRMRALFRTGRRLFVASGLLSLASALLGLQEAWVNWVFLLLFLAGVADMAIAAGLSALSAARDDDDGSRVAVEIDEAGIKVWFGGKAQRNRRRYLEDRERSRPDDGMRYVDGVRVPVAQVDEYLGIGYRWDEAGGYWAQTGVSCEPRPPEKRLMPPLSPSWREQGVEFPDGLAYSEGDGLTLPWTGQER